MTYSFIVQIDSDKRTNPDRLARAIARVINHATEVDIEGAEVLDSRIGQVTVKRNN